MRRTNKARGAGKRGWVWRRISPTRKRRLASTCAKWAWHRNALLYLRDRLLAERSERLTQAATPLESHSLDLADSATDEFDHDLVLSELSREQDALYEIEDALRRIQNGAYGICEVTGRAISKRRLRAVPWTRFSETAAASLEHEGAVKHAQLGELSSVWRPGAEALERKVEELEAQKRERE